MKICNSFIVAKLIAAAMLFGTSVAYAGMSSDADIQALDVTFNREATPFPFDFTLKAGLTEGLMTKNTILGSGYIGFDGRSSGTFTFALRFTPGVGLGADRQHIIITGQNGGSISIAYVSTSGGSLDTSEPSGVWWKFPTGRSYNTFNIVINNDASVLADTYLISMDAAYYSI